MWFGPDSLPSPLRDGGASFLGEFGLIPSLPSPQQGPAELAHGSICCGLRLWFLDGPADPQGLLAVCCSHLCPAGL